MAVLWCRHPSPMNRKEFLLTGGCCAAVALLRRASAATTDAATTTAASTGIAPTLAATAATATAAPAGPPVTSAEQRVAFGERWAKQFFDVLDAELDAPTRERIMRANGRACHEGAVKNKAFRELPHSVDEFIAHIHTFPGGKDVIRREGDTVYFSYVQNPRGLKVADGYCLCPLVETGPAGLSGTYCFCSVGYVQHMFELMAGHPVRVQLLESLKRGGKGCKFRIDLA